MKGWGEASDETAHDFFRSVLRFGPVLPKQQQAGYGAPYRCYNREITGKLGWGANVGSGINARYGQECHVGVQ